MEKKRRGFNVKSRLMNKFSKKQLKRGLITVGSIIAVIGVASILSYKSMEMTELRDTNEELRECAVKSEKGKEKLQLEKKTLTLEKEELLEDKKNNEQKIEDKKVEVEALKKQYSNLNKRKEVRGSQQVASRSKKSESVVDTSGGGWQTVQASAYSTDGNDPYVSAKWGGKTASGNYPVEGTDIAVSKSQFALGTRFQIQFPSGCGLEGLNGSTFVATDTGNWITPGKIDIFLSSTQKCINFGRRNVKIRVLN